MVDQTLPSDRPADTVCPWCSASVTSETATCPSCGAILISGEERELPGVTAVDPAAARGDKKPAGRGRLLSWISGEYPDDAPAIADSQALAPPDPEVQREILRLEIEAELANLQAEADSLLAEAAAEGRNLPPDVQAFVAGVAAVDASIPAGHLEEPEIFAIPSPSTDSIAPPPIDPATAPAAPPASEAGTSRRLKRGRRPEAPPR